MRASEEVVPRLDRRKQARARQGERNATSWIQKLCVSPMSKREQKSRGLRGEGGA